MHFYPCQFIGKSQEDFEEENDGEPGVQWREREHWCIAQELRTNPALQLPKDCGV